MKSDEMIPVNLNPVFLTPDFSDTVQFPGFFFNGVLLSALLLGSLLRAVLELFPKLTVFGGAWSVDSFSSRDLAGLDFTTERFF